MFYMRYYIIYNKQSQIYGNYFLANKENCRYLTQVWQLCLAPFSNGHCLDPLARRSDASCYAHSCRGTQGTAQGLYHFAVAKGCLDKQLCLVLALST